MDKVILITGGSRGIGAATARRAARAGYAVAVNYRARADAAEALVAEITAGGGTAVAIQADVAREDDVVALFDETRAHLGTPTALVNSAGVTLGRQPVPEFDAGILSYLAHADGPDIEVYVDVLLTGDVEVVRINGEDATLVGFRSWRSPPAAALISPTSVEVEIVDARLDAPLIYSIDVVLPL